MQINCVRSGFSTTMSLKSNSRLSFKGVHETDTQEGAPNPTKVCQNRKLAQVQWISVILVLVTVSKLEPLTWKSDDPCTEEGRRGHGGKAPRCASAGESTRPHLPDDLKQKQKVPLNSRRLSVKNSPHPSTHGWWRAEFCRFKNRSSCYRA